MSWKIVTPLLITASLVVRKSICSSMSPAQNYAFSMAPNSRNCITTSEGMTEQQVTFLSFRESLPNSSNIIRALRCSWKDWIVGICIMVHQHYQDICIFCPHLSIEFIHINFNKLLTSTEPSVAAVIATLTIEVSASLSHCSTAIWCSAMLKRWDVWAQSCCGCYP